MRVIGTAGHVDHGKSTLVKRLTGIDPDRLAEEKARKLTIDLGFAWFGLGDQQMVGVVDVPGHRDFIENMLAGVGGIDAALLVIAADEGVMPQTREHLAILDLLNVTHAVVALTKIDIVQDAEWLELVETEIMETLQSTSLATTPIVHVSAHTGEGIETLRATLTELLTHLPRQPDYNQPRLSIDRVFTLSGFGTVVTGTLLGGKLHVGDAIIIQPGDLQGRVRGLQSYKQQLETAYPGSRVAVNITGIDHKSIQRGQLLTFPGQIRPTRLADAHFRHLSSASRPLKYNTEVKFFVGAAESIARVRLLETDLLHPGESGWIQLQITDPLPLARDDRYILRYPSPAETIGGGVIVDATPKHKWKRRQIRIIQRLEVLLEGTPAQRIANAAEGSEPVKRDMLQKKTGYSDDELESGLVEALNTGLIVELSAGNFLAMNSLHNLLNKITTSLESFHHDHPLKLGMSREELRSRLEVKNTTLTLLLETAEHIKADEHLIRLANHEIRFTPNQTRQIEVLADLFQAAPYTPPSYTESAKVVGEDVLRALLERGDIVQISPEVLLSRDIYEEMVHTILTIIDENGEIDAKVLRDHFNTSRKYAISLLEYLDDIGVTTRMGDARLRGPKSRDPQK